MKLAIAAIMSVFATTAIANAPAAKCDPAKDKNCKAEVKAAAPAAAPKK
jgi:hypothetical protein